MPKNNVIKFLVTKYEKEKIIELSKLAGFHNLSTYLRDLALNTNYHANLRTIVKLLEDGKNT
jgi:hypothetical protein